MSEENNGSGDGQQGGQAAAGAGSQGAAAAAGAPKVTAMAAAEAAAGQQAAAAASAAGTPPSRSYVDGWVKADGTFDHGVIQKMPAGPRREFAEKVVSRFADMDSFLDGSQNAFSLVGRKGLMPLPATATEEDRKAYHAKMAEVLGIPKDKTGYKIEKPADLPPEQWSDEHATRMKQLFHENNVPPAVAEKLVAAQTEFVKQSMIAAEQAAVAQQQAAIKELQKEWGDNYSKNVITAARAARTLGLDPTDAAIGDNPAVMRAMIQFAGLVSEHVLVTPGAEANSSVGLEAQMQQLTEKAMSEGYLSNETDPRYRIFVEKQTELAKRIAASRKG